jgi:hypothetical protein
MIDKFPQKLTYWKNNGLDEYNQPTWSGPFTTKCRWEYKQRKFITENGVEIRGNSTIYLPEPLITQGDYVYKGVSESTEPDSKTYEVKRNIFTPSLRGNRTEYSYIV